MIAANAKMHHYVQYSATYTGGDDLLQIWAQIVQYRPLFI